MKQNIGIALAFVIVIALPFVFQPERISLETPDDTVVVITPHTESIRQEFAAGFADWYRERTGRTVRVDYRVIGGTSEIARFLNSEYTNAFRLYWTSRAGREWTNEVQEGFNNHRLDLSGDPADDSPAQAARRAFLASNLSCGIDVFFGGGTYDFIQNTNRGYLVDAGLLDRHPEWFMETATPGEIPPAIPREFAGETFYDAGGRWYGAVLSSYGIIYNRDSLRRLGFTEAEHPRQWADLADPRLFGEVAVCDPTKSGSMTQAFEMIIQQQMQERLAELKADHPGNDPSALEARAVREGWMRGFRLIQIISANARYFTETSQKPNIDVAVGDCAAGMSIDFYGRFQQENIVERSGDTRFGFHTPAGGTTISADPVGKLRGARNPEVARLFVEYVLSPEGQRLWNFRVGTPGGPRTFPLRRPPIHPALYTPELNEYRSDPDFVPYIAAQDFHYRSDWTGRLFSEIRALIRICFIDARKELVAAWAAILRAEAEGRQLDADRARAVFTDLSRISYDRASTEIREGIRGAPLDEVRLARDLGNAFRSQYNEARRLADGG